MGRPSWSDRKTVEQCKSIDIPWLNRHGYFCGLKTGGMQWKNALGDVIGSISIQVSVDEEFHGGKYVRFFYTQTKNSTQEKTELDYKVQLVTTPCNFGGVRYWFICPLVVSGKPCNRRVANLYLPPGSKYFGCRHCYNLTYRCQKEHNKRVDAIIKNPELLEAYLGFVIILAEITIKPLWILGLSIQRVNISLRDFTASNHGHLRRFSVPFS
ncbi:hypothetical protein ACFL6S_18275 [Candidatus Poribacteria bacterium]